MLKQVFAFAFFIGVNEHVRVDNQCVVDEHITALLMLAVLLHKDGMILNVVVIGDKVSIGVQHTSVTALLELQISVLIVDGLNSEEVIVL